MKIILDAFGGDNAPLEIIKGAELSISEFGIDVILTGDEGIIRKTAQDNGISLDHMEIVHAPGVITMDDEAGAVVKRKTDSSMTAGLSLLAEGKGDAFVSAGNSGALVVGATLIVKRIRGVKRPGFAPVMPTETGCAMLIDCGANVECRPEMLLQFGQMGSIYMEKVLGVKNPRVGLANVGTEEHKGGGLQHETFALLKDSGLHFVGNIEGRDFPAGACDVLVTDGFTGNLILKTYEGVAMVLMDKIKDMFTKNMKTKLAAAMVMSDLKVMKQQFDYNEYGGSPIMGVSKPVFKAHGSAKAKTIKSAIRLTKQYVEGNVTKEITNLISACAPKEE